ncbi:uncharacterized protein METZ01_LOCUS213548, partial [marine metagenome]
PSLRGSPGLVARKRPAKRDARPRPLRKACGKRIGGPQPEFPRKHIRPNGTGGSLSRQPAPRQSFSADGGWQRLRSRLPNRMAGRRHSHRGFGSSSSPKFAGKHGPIELFGDPDATFTL